ncbi:MAG TPA: hypothetical protein VMA98_09170 [Candidatus Acidoferrales bacterium]|nr:hypothetical protein [Candidatus Acidoferrales bacterium]
MIVASMVLSSGAVARAADQAETLSDAWWTGPLLAPSAGTLSRGHVLVEPYVYDVITPAARTHAYGSLTYLIYGVTDRFNVGLIPTFGYTAMSGASGSALGLGDLSVMAQYRLLTFHPGSATPGMAVNVEETLPTGRYDQLGANPNNGVGSGVYATKVSLYMQDYAWLANGRILRLRFNLSHSFSGAANVRGTSVYNTGNGFSGSAYPGNADVVDAAAEYSVTRNWVAASDVVYSYNGRTYVNGNSAMTLGNSGSFAFAPALEYNWTANAGIIFGVRIIPKGFDTSSSLTPVVAINMVR